MSKAKSSEVEVSEEPRVVTRKKAKVEEFEGVELNEAYDREALAFQVYCEMIGSSKYPDDPEHYARFAKMSKVAADTFIKVMGQ